MPLLVHALCDNEIGAGRMSVILNFDHFFMESTFEILSPSYFEMHEALLLTEGSFVHMFSEEKRRKP
jgi:hypothetical protein